MVNKVLLATDGSDTAAQAVKFTLTMAKNNPLMEVTIINARPSLDILEKYHPFDSQDVNDKVTEASMELLNVTQEVFESEGLGVHIEVLFGEPGQAIAEYARDKGYDMIIMGTRSPSNLSGIILGSVSHKVLHLSTVPVLFVVKGSRLTVNKILLSTDGSDNAMRAASYTLNMVKNNPHLRVTVLNVRSGSDILVRYNPFDNQAISKEKCELSESIIKHTRALFENEGFVVRSDIVFGEPGQTISEYARDKGYDMIIMGTRGLSKLSGIILGSISHQVLRHSTVPVLFVK